MISTRNGLLDVLRGIAVAAVVAYHVWPNAVPGGFLGVDVFFVLSGFLITGGLVDHLGRRHGGVLRRFWARRVRRLLPGLAFMVLIMTAVAGVIGGSPAARLLPQLIGAVTFSSNWYQACSGQSYFDRFDAPLLQHLWSLAVEEQMYLVWPVVLLVLVRFIPRTGVRGVVIASVALTSASAMAVSYAAGQDPSRLYFGTDTHGFSALIGATAACAVGVLPRALSGRYRLTLAASAILGGLFALAGIVVAFATMNDTGAVAYRGGILLVDVATAVLILIVCELHHERLARFLPARPLVWLGVRSYGLYLWHWPVVVLTAHLWPTPSGATSLAWGTVMIAVSLGMAAVSWRYVEAPAVRGTWVRSLGSGRLRGVGLRRRMVVVLTSLVLVFGLSAHAVATSPGRSSAESRIDAGLQALQAAASHTNPPPRAQGSPRRAQAGAAKPPAVLGSNITVLGDSVTVASAPALLDRFPGIRIDAKVGAQLWDAPAEVARLRVQGLLRSYVVVALGTNGDVAPYVLPQIVSAAGPGHWFVLVTAHGDRSWIGPVDAKLRSFAQRTPRTALADWDAATPAVRDFADDGIHPGPQGGGVFVDVIERALRHLRASA